MFTLKDKNLGIFFGGTKNKILPSYFRQQPRYAEQLVGVDPFGDLSSQFNFKSIIFLHQKHGVKGRIFTDLEKAKKHKSFCIEGDYIITNLQSVAIGVVTADCAPVVLFDPENNVVAAVHSGWKGSAAGIVLKAIGEMQQVFGSRLENIRVFFGPAARSCCYEVQPDFVGNLLKPSIISKKGKIYFDNPTFIKNQLIKLGIKEDLIDDKCCVCTICDDNFCSHRRVGSDDPGFRNITLACLE